MNIRTGERGTAKKMRFILDERAARRDGEVKYLASLVIPIFSFLFYFQYFFSPCWARVDVCIRSIRLFFFPFACRRGFNVYTA